MITVKIPSFSYRDQPVLKNIDECYKPGTTYGVVGLNGAGKTTFFRLLAGAIRHEQASCSRNGLPLRLKDLAFIDTELFFYPKLTAREFLSVFPSGLAAYDEEKLGGLFKLPLDALIEEYSTGMKKKLLLMSQVKQNKDIYILDEPFNGLDLETNKILEVIISILNQRGKTVFISSHILEPLLNICHEIHQIKEQTIYRRYTKEEFTSIADDLFGNYSRQIENELLNLI